jgi:hypothetical protein
MNIQYMTSCMTVPIINPWNMAFLFCTKMIDKWMNEWIVGFWLVFAPQPSLHLVCIPFCSAPQLSYIFYLKGYPGSQLAT